MAILLRLARFPAAGWFMAFVLAHAAFLLPAKRLFATRTLLAFYHPQPSYPVHILLVPRRRVTALTAPGASEAEFLQDLFAAVRHLVQMLELEPAGYRLIANGGAYQEVAQLHFHLVSDGPVGAGESPFASALESAIVTARDDAEV
jgi:histidine triad (HIT) family protein